LPRLTSESIQLIVCEKGGRCQAGGHLKSETYFYTLVVTMWEVWEHWTDVRVYSCVSLFRSNVLQRRNVIQNVNRSFGIPPAHTVVLPHNWSIVDSHAENLGIECWLSKLIPRELVQLF
jgi:hypothetical protein